MTSDLVNAYYEGIARKDGWQQPLSDSLRFVSPGGKVTEGKGSLRGSEQPFPECCETCAEERNAD